MHNELSFATSRSSFTLIELLVVIAILSILAVTVILTLNPSELLKQARDSTRLSDIAQINNALNLYQVDSPNGSFGNASTTYISIPDPSATSTTQGNQCSGLGLPSLPAGYSYHCSASSTYRNSDGTGWLPVNFQAMSYGSPLGVLPIDPINNGSSTYYTYTPGGSWQLTATPESNKIRTTQANQSTGAITAGSDLTLSPLFNPNGLVGYWKFDEDWTDSSGGGNNGTSRSNGTGAIGFVFNGKVGSAGSFTAPNPGQNNTGSVYTSGHISLGNAFTAMVWIYPTISAAGERVVLTNSYYWNTTTGGFSLTFPSSPSISFKVGGGGTYTYLSSGSNQSLNQWTHIAAVYNNGTMTIYVNGVKTGTKAGTYADSTYQTGIGAYGPDANSPNQYGFNGNIDDVRIYNRALSASEIYVLYNATR